MTFFFAARLVQPPGTISGSRGLLRVGSSVAAALMFLGVPMNIALGVSYFSGTCLPSAAGASSAARSAAAMKSDEEWRVKANDIGSNESEGYAWAEFRWFGRAAEAVGI